MITNERIRYILTELKHRGFVNLPQCMRDDSIPIRAQYIGSGQNVCDSKNDVIRYSNRCEEIDLLHEIGHHIYGYDCCREHDEFAATGIAICLATMLNIDQGDLLERMSEYAGFSVCPRLDYKRLHLGKATDIVFQNSICIGNEIIKLENGIDALRIRQREEPDAPYLQNQIDNNRQRIKALQWVLNTCNFKSTLPD